MLGGALVSGTTVFLGMPFGPDSTCALAWADPIAKFRLRAQPASQPSQPCTENHASCVGLVGLACLAGLTWPGEARPALAPADPGLA